MASLQASAPGHKTVLNVGCGYPPRQKLHPHFHGPDWREIRLDLDPAVGPDIVCSITDMSPVTTASVDAVWSSLNLEHLQRHEMPLALAEFIRVLKPQGLLLLMLPDLCAKWRSSSSKIASKTRPTPRRADRSPRST